MIDMVVFYLMLMILVSGIITIFLYERRKDGSIKPENSENSDSRYIRRCCVVHVQRFRYPGGSERVRCVSHSRWFLLRLGSGAASSGELCSRRRPRLCSARLAACGLSTGV